MGFSRPIIGSGSVSYQGTISLETIQVNEIIEVIKNLYGNQFDLKFPKRYIYRSHGNNQSESIGVSSITPGVGGFSKIYFGNLYCSLLASDTEEHLIDCRFANSTFLKHSGLVGTGYNGLKHIPFSSPNIISNYIEMSQPVTTNMSWFYFDGWIFEIK